MRKCKKIRKYLHIYLEISKKNRTFAAVNKFNPLKQVNGMTREKFKDLLWRNGYKPYEPTEDEMEYGKGWWYEHKGWMHKEFGETDVAFDTDNGGCVWLSIIYQEARLEYDVRNITVANMLLAAFDAEPLKQTSDYDERVD